MPDTNRRLVSQHGPFVFYRVRVDGLKTDNKTITIRTPITEVWTFGRNRFVPHRIRIYRVRPTVFVIAHRQSPTSRCRCIWVYRTVSFKTCQSAVFSIEFNTTPPPLVNLYANEHSSRPVQGRPLVSGDGSNPAVSFVRSLSAPWSGLGKTL